MFRGDLETAARVHEQLRKAAHSLANVRSQHLAAWNLGRSNTSAVRRSKRSRSLARSFPRLMQANSGRLASLLAAESPAISSRLTIFGRGRGGPRIDRNPRGAPSRTMRYVAMAIETWRIAVRAARRLCPSGHARRLRRPMRCDKSSASSPNHDLRPPHRILRETLKPDELATTDDGGRCTLNPEAADRTRA